jgi:hypothetical protein
MHLTAVVTKTDLASLVESLTPLSVIIDEPRGRVVTLGRPTKVELVAGSGLRLRGDAHITWDFAHIPIPVTLRAWQLLLVPRIVVRDRAHVLAFDPVIEELDLKLVPGFVDEKVADAIRNGIAQNRERLAWNFARTLSKRLPLPAKISPPKTFEILVVGGEVSVSESEVRFTVRFEARFETRAAAPGTEREQKAVPPAPARATAR